jgi:hypothetical protein
LTEFNLVGSNALSPLFNATRTGGSYANWTYDAVKGAVVSANSNYLVWMLPDHMKCKTGGVSRLPVGIAIRTAQQIFGRNNVGTTLNMAYADASYNVGTVYTNGADFAGDVSGSNNWDRIVFWITTYTSSGQCFVSSMKLTTLDFWKPATKMDRAKGWIGFPFLISLFNYNETLTGNLRLTDSTGALIEDNALTLSNKANAIMLDVTTMEKINIKTIELSCDKMFNFYADVETPCKNPIMMISRNQFGGLLSWVFETTQTITFENSNGKSMKRIKMIADRLSSSQWETLNDFFSPSEYFSKMNIYRSPQGAIETEDKAVYLLDREHQDNNYGGYGVLVKVLKSKPSMNTNSSQQVFEMEIEFDTL